MIPKIEKTDKIPDDVNNEDILIRFTIDRSNQCHLWWSGELGIEQTFRFMYWQIVSASIKTGIKLFTGCNN